MRKYLLIMLLLGGLSACSTTRQVANTDVAAPQVNKQSVWAKRQAVLRQRMSWQLAGRAGVAYRGENWPFALNWQQHSPSSYRMVIQHPLTKSTLGIINKTARQVTLEANGRIYRDTSAERLIEKNLGVKMPVKGMRYWVLGILSPEHPRSMPILDGIGRPRQIKQAGWTIDYLRYAGNQLTALPTLIKVHRTSPEPVQVKLSVKKWNP